MPFRRLLAFVKYAQGSYRDALDNIEVLGEDFVSADLTLLKLRAFTLARCQRYDAALKTLHEILDMPAVSETDKREIARIFDALDRIRTVKHYEYLGNSRRHE